MIRLSSLPYQSWQMWFFLIVKLTPSRLKQTWRLWLFASLSAINMSQYQGAEAQIPRSDHQSSRHCPKVEALLFPALNGICIWRIMRQQCVTLLLWRDPYTSCWLARCPRSYQLRIPESAQLEHRTHGWSHLFALLWWSASCVSYWLVKHDAYY